MKKIQSYFTISFKIAFKPSHFQPLNPSIQSCPSNFLDALDLDNTNKYTSFINLQFCTFSECRVVKIQNSHSGVFGANLAIVNVLILGD